MCGIYGHIGPSSNPDIMARLTTCLRHRGPDEQREQAWPGLYFFHARLAIQDVAHGQQPMRRGPLTVIFNGEIYNHRELRERFGLECTTRSDTDTLLALYEQRGRAALTELDGMFAFALYDERDRTLLLARDRAGEKPLYYGRLATGEFVFASELNTLRWVWGDRLSYANDNLSAYLYRGFLAREETPYREIRELLPGHYLALDLDRPDAEPRSYWSIETHYGSGSSITDEAAALAQLDTHFARIIARQLDTSDIEVGTFLSGGIDSGLVTAYAVAHQADLRTFTVSFPGTYDEAPLARQVAEHFGTRHTEIRIDFADLEQRITTILGAYGEPFADDSAIPSYYVSRAAKEHLTVILTGDGGDELFGGYRRYVPFRYRDLFASRANFLSRNLEIWTRSWGNEKQSKLNYLHRLVAVYNQDPTDTYLSSTLDVFLPVAKAAGDPERMIAKWAQANDLTGLDKIMALDFQLLLPGVLLPKMDIASMQHSLETRAPFLARELLELAPRLADNLKIRGTTTKYLLRKLAARKLPAVIVDQPKRGFEIPLKRWMDGELRTILQDLVGSPNAFARTLLDPAYIQDLLANRLPTVSAEQRAKQLFTLLGLEIWDRQNREIG